MPTVTLNKKAFEKLVGKKLPLDELKDRISMLGTDLEKIEGNEIHVEVFANRPDLLSEQGFGRAFASFIGTKTGLRKYKVEKPKQKLIVDQKALPKQWPYAVACMVTGLKLNEEKVREIIQLQEKLGTTLTRNRKKGGIGLYPLEKIEFPITFTGRKAKDISFRPLEFPKELNGAQILQQHKKGKEYAHICEGWNVLPIFVDSKGTIMSMPPIINSHDVGKITNDTKDLFIEATGPDLNALKAAINIIATSLIEMGGTCQGLEVAYPKEKMVIPDLTPKKMKIDIDYASKRLGLDINEKDVKKYLERMGFDYEKGVVLIPAYRNDILHQADLVENIAIAFGYEHFDAEIPKVATIGQESDFERFKDKIVDIMVGLGLQELNTYNLTGRDVQTTKMLLNIDPIAVKNPTTTEYDVVRSWVIPSLLDILAKNKHHEYPQNIFDLGVVAKLGESETGVVENVRLAVAVCHEKADYTAIKQALDYLLRLLNIKYEVDATEHPSFITGRVGRGTIAKKKIAYLGEIHPQVLANFDLTMPVAALEINLTELYNFMKK